MKYKDFNLKTKNLTIYYKFGKVKPVFHLIFPYLIFIDKLGAVFSTSFFLTLRLFPERKVNKYCKM